MLSYDDCLGFCELTPEEIAAIARHEHLPEILALELGAHLCTTPQGKETLKRMILDDIEEARERGDMKAAARLELVLQHFVETCLDRPSPAEHHRPADGVGKAMATPDALSSGDTLDSGYMHWASTPRSHLGCVGAWRPISRRCCTISGWTTRACRAASGSSC